MEQIIQRYDAIFTGINEPITLSIPRGSEEVAIRVYRGPQELSVFVLQEFPSPLPENNYARTFTLILADQPVPTNFKKYVATLPFGPGLIETHLIEVAPALAVEG